MHVQARQHLTIAATMLREILRSEPIFESLRRWVPSTALVAHASVPVAATIDAMDAAGVRLGLICAWWGPRGPLIDNDEVAAFMREYPDRLVGVASVDLSLPLAAVRAFTMRNGS